MSTLLVLAAAAWLFWNLSFRAVYISLKYRNARPIPYPGGMDKESIFQLLKEKLDYPTKKALYYNERGEITIECKYGQHPLPWETGAALPDTWKDRLPDLLFRQTYCNPPP